jgi:hypothetical protein
MNHGGDTVVTDKQLIEADEWADCWVCSSAFRRRRQTLRYCAKCERGFCEGEHGTFARGHALCLICGARKEDKAR